MAKQDLVVKLMLDSGAFGNDIRQAERKAQDFSNKMQNAGKTAGDLGKELNITTGALGKLGGMLTGAGAVVAAFSAFKSVMESTHETSKKFHGTLDGISGVFKEIQESLAKMDFEKWNNAASIFQSYKNASISNADLGISQISYDMLNADNMKEVKKLMADFSVATTPEAKQKIKNEILEILDKMLGQFENLSNEIDSNVIKNIIAGSKIQESQITSDFAKEQIKKVNENINSGAKKDDMALWTGVKAELDRLYGEYDVYKNLSQDELKSAGESLIGRKTHLNNYEVYKQKSEDFYNQWLEYFNKNIDIIFRKQLYDMTEEDFSKIAGKVMGADNEAQRLNELRKEISGWSASSQPKKDPEIRNVMSIGYLEEMIAAQKKLMNGFNVGTPEWWDAVDAINAYQTELNELKVYQNELLGIVDDNNYAVEGSISYYKELIRKTENLRDSKKIESEEWHKLTEQLKEYTKTLDELREKQAAYDGKIPIPKTESKSDNEEYNEKSEKKRKAVVDAWNEREKHNKNSQAWDEANEKLKEYISEYQKFTKSLDKDDPVDAFKEKLSDINIVLSSSISMLDALSATLANSEKESVRQAAAWVDVFSTIGAGVQNYISIMQSAIATDEAYAMAKATGQAASLPFPANIAAIATVVATLTSVIAKINSIRQSSGKFAEGGIVGGTSYSGDKLFAMVNSGEMILNKRQQGNLANMLGGGGQVEFHISGDSLVGVLNNKRNKTNLTR